MAHAVGAVLGAVLLSAGLACGAVAADQPDIRSATIEGRAVAYRILGSGGPTVVMISGLGDGMTSFDAVAAELAKTTTVIVYDRTGYGRSDPAKGSRDAVAAEAELSGLLTQSGVPGPYVLVGHSLGGLFAEYYAAKHPDQIAGLVLEESRPAEFTQICTDRKIAMCAPTVAMMRFSPQGAQAETAALSATSEEVQAIPRLAGKPVLVMSRSTKANPNPFDGLWTKAQADLAARYPGSVHYTAPAGGHYIHREQKTWFLTMLQQWTPRR